jgi:DNA-directed RNA polymerase specialized sigma24 family protein
MHEAVARLSPDEAQRLIDDDCAFQEWIKEHGVEGHRIFGQLIVRSSEWVPPPPPPHVDLRRPDAADLRAFVAKAPGLPARLKQVSSLCLERGLTLDQCAAELGIARATVRVHLRRLRAVLRECKERERLRR